MSISLPPTAAAPCAPIACTLGAGEYADRTACIAELNRTALRAYRRDGLTLMLDYTPDAAAQVGELVARERHCCAFLAFRVEGGADRVRLTIQAPAEAHDGVDAIFDPFLTGAENAEAERPHADSHARGRAPGDAAGTAAAAALACGVCCVVPFALPAVALASVGGVLAVFARVYWWAVGLAVVAVAAAWLWVGWQSVRARRRPARSTLRAMTVATLLLAAALSWPYVEPLVQRALRA